MISKIAWRNIWRSPFRSAVVILSIVLGIWAATFLVSFSYGLNDQRTREIIESTLSHIQVHHVEFSKEQEVAYFINQPEKYFEVLDTSSHVKGYCTRILVNGMVASPNSAAAAKILGVNPQSESQVTNLHEKLVEGDWFQSGGSHPVVIGQKLAEKLQLKVRNKLVITFQDEEANLVSAAFRVSGIYKTNSTLYDELNLLVPQESLESLLHVQNKYHEMAILLNDNDYLDTVKSQLNINPINRVETWKELSPELGYADDILAQMLFLFVGIIMLALAFGIVNNMLMAVLERKRELGMLQAVGMNKRKLFLMIVYETIFMGLAGGPLGILLGYLTISYFSKVGIDLSFVGEGLNQYGIGHFVYPHIENEFYGIIAIMVIVMTLLSSIYPARKALKLNPVDSIRSI